MLKLHRQQIELFGGAAGLLSQSLLESAISQPQMIRCYETTADLFDLAAAYVFHIAKNHPFQDGNKRVALHAGLTFLHVNGVLIDASQEKMYDETLQLVTSVIDKKQFATFLRTHRS